MNQDIENQAYDASEKEQVYGSAFERETIINFNNAEAEASYYTLNYNKRKELLELAEKYPEQVRIVSDNGECIEAVLPKRWIKIRPPREMSEERRAELVMRGRRLAEMQKLRKQ